MLTAALLEAVVLLLLIHHLGGVFGFHRSAPPRC
jgi:hypothetical protein